MGTSAGARAHLLAPTLICLRPANAAFPPRYRHFCGAKVRAHRLTTVTSSSPHSACLLLRERPAPHTVGSWWESTPFRPRGSFPPQRAGGSAFPGRAVRGRGGGRPPRARSLTGVCTVREGAPAKSDFSGRGRLVRARVPLKIHRTPRNPTAAVLDEGRHTHRGRGSHSPWSRPPQRGWSAPVPG